MGTVGQTVTSQRLYHQSTLFCGLKRIKLTTFKKKYLYIRAEFLVLVEGRVGTGNTRDNLSGKQDQINQEARLKFQAMSTILSSPVSPP